MTFEEGLAKVLAEQTAVIIDRHRKYGPGNITATGVHGLLVRMQDKLARIAYAHKDCPLGDCKASADFADDSEADSWLDLASYAWPIYRMLTTGTWCEWEEPCDHAEWYKHPGPSQCPTCHEGTEQDEDADYTDYHGIVTLKTEYGMIESSVDKETNGYWVDSYRDIPRGETSTRFGQHPESLDDSWDNPSSLA